MEYVGGWTALHDAAYRGSTEKTCPLLESGHAGGIDKIVERGYARDVRVLLGKGADVSIAGEDGYTALHVSAEKGHLAVTKMFLKAGADLEARRHIFIRIFMDGTHLCSRLRLEDTLR